MKKVIHQTAKTILISLLLIGLSSCDKEMVNQEYLKQIEELKKEIVELKKQLDDRDGEVKEPDFIIPIENARQLYGLYTPRAELIDSIVREDGQGKPFQATRNFHLEIDDLQQYLRFVRQETKNRKIEVSGYSFYFGIYPDDYPRDQKLYAKRQTLFIAPTIKRASNGVVSHAAFSIGENNEPLFLDDFFNDRKSTKVGSNTLNGKKMNQASLFNFSTTSTYSAQSLVANELTGSPPKGNQ
ncbi:hypothetical protein [Aquimarina pacifica]|uniref:hypothetical protein n=1 Tax=Aquimarina pacifica TaxID=1296415 RepID=UPI0004709F65|nr:hypothetical protein [Aquimarina pacifica]